MIVAILPVSIHALSVTASPDSIEAIENEISNIENNLGEAECGGWIPFEETTNMSVENFVADVSGVPGTDGNALGNIKSGMGLRNDETGFKYPEGATGFTSACEPGNPWFYESNPCQRPGPDAQGYPDIGGKIYSNGENANSDPLLNNVKWTCDALCDDMNRRWGYLVWIESCPDPEEGEDPPNEGYEESNCYDSDTQDAPTTSIVVDDGCSLSEEWRYCCTRSPIAPNCIPCTGGNCGQALQTVDGNTSWGSPYVSYYRRYEGSCSRSPLPSKYVPKDDTSFSEVPVSCYGQYEKYDTKTTASPQNQFKCVIANTYPNKNYELTNMWKTQKPDMSKVDFGKIASESLWDDPPSEEYQITDLRTFNAETDTWYKKLGGGFFLTNKEVLQKNSWDISHALLSPGESEVRAYPQLTEDQLFSSGSYIRAFDDSVSSDRGERRTFVEWWQELETEMSTLLLPARIRLILPTAWKMGLDTQDPSLFSGNRIELEKDAKSIERLLQAKEDLLGEIARYFERSMLLHIKEEPVPILLPLADPIELRAHANLWCAWYIIHENKKRGEGAELIKNCDRASGDVGLIIQRLREYADRIDDIRILRSDLYHYEGNLLERQKEILTKIETWYSNTLDEYDGYITSLQPLENVREEWKTIQNSYIEFHDEINMPWCLNERFTLPIYSLLDDGGNTVGAMDKDTYWFPGRELNGNLTGGIDDIISYDNDPLDFSKFPRLHVEAPDDVIIDFSNIDVSEGAILLPVLKPIQVRLDWSQLVAPSSDDDNPEIPEPLPPLPQLPQIRNIVQSELAKVHLGQEPLNIQSRIPQPRKEISANFFPRVTDIITRMKYSYQRFWKSVTMDPENVKDGTEEDCFLSSNPCVHTEMDLLERFQRICARPGVLLPEDFMSIGEKRDINTPDQNTCARDDFACEIQRGEKWYPAEGWSIHYPDDSDQQNFIDMIRRKIFLESLQSGDLPYEINREDILPSFEIRDTYSPIHPSVSSQPSDS